MVADEQILCAGCSMVFVAPKAFIDRRRADHQRFYCPAGCWNVYRQPSDLDKCRERAVFLEKQLAGAQERARRAEETERAARGQATRAKNALARARKVKP